MGIRKEIQVLQLRDLEFNMSLQVNILLFKPQFLYQQNRYNKDFIVLLWRVKESVCKMPT